MGNERAFGSSVSPWFDNCRNMDETSALCGVSTLAHETRLRVFRTLIVEGPGGLAAGVPPSTLSAHPDPSIWV